jgi:hypothetical protein
VKRFWFLFHYRYFKGIAFHSTGACGGYLTTGDLPIFLFSPGWPENYYNAVDCTWLIYAPDSTVELNILSLDIEPHRTCAYDRLMIRDGEKHLKNMLSTLTHSCVQLSSCLYTATIHSVWNFTGTISKACKESV